MVNADAVVSNPLGGFLLRHHVNTAGNIYTYQTINNLPTGRYTVTALVKSSGGQKAAGIIVKNFTTADQYFDASAAIAAWQPVSFTVEVTNGTAEIGIWSDVLTPACLTIDSVTLTKN